ncbi:MAG: alpha-amylase family glycosyl hydrolase [Candidatus Dormibacteraeota bacterium]|nr:alpha-amylase family glycosyl hydrolase [Candidatus Dormibacteraeota bacterium]
MTRPWWRGAAFYEIYVRSFADSNDDGVGDLPGITSRLEYVKTLGVDAIWLTPFYPSPQRDHGYDVANYVDVNPEYGTLDDFDRLVKRAHDLGLKLLVDIVPNHTSEQHPWFKSALASPDSPYRARYQFVDAKPDGSPPNNWVSEFGGAAWTREEAGGQWYLHLFAPEQPDLNWWNPEVPAEFEGIIKFWLDRGADGFRIDVASALFKRADLADRPLVHDRLSGTLQPDRAFSIFDQPQLHDVYRRWREIADGYGPGRVLVGEMFEPRRHTKFIVPDQLDMAFAMLVAPWDAAAWRRLIDVARRALKGAGNEPSWTLSNHDVVRQVTRFGGGAMGRDRARAALLLVLGLPGQVFLYQGEEMGLEEVDLPDEDRQDPIFFRTGRRQPGRDGCRVPLPWSQGRPNAGFSTTSPWLPTPPGWDRYAVDAQERSAASMLHHYRDALALRRRLAGRLPERLDWCPAPNGVLVYQRGPLTVACNFSLRRVRLKVGGRLLAASSSMVRHRGDELRLLPNSAAWLDA